MKGTDKFKQTIQEYLRTRADYDLLFARTLAKEGKNIDDCITYILNQVKASGCNGFDDEEIFSMAVHYYDEDNIQIGDTNVKAQVVVNHQIVLTEAEKEEARKAAQKRIEDDIVNKARLDAMKTKKVAEKPTSTPKKAEKPAPKKPAKKEEPKRIELTLF